MSILFHLAPGWALGADQNQWIVLRSRKRQDKSYYQPLSFIGSNKTVLLRVLREKGIQPTPDALAELDALPERFLDWRDTIFTKQSPKTKQPSDATDDCNNFVTPTSVKENDNE